MGPGVITIKTLEDPAQFLEGHLTILNLVYKMCHDGIKYINNHRLSIFSEPWLDPIQDYL